MGSERLVSGNLAVAYGVKLSKPDVICVYPITPQTSISEYLAEFVAHGELKAQYVPMEGEHSAMAACIAAEMMGARTFTASSSQGLAYMHECLHYASGARMPIGMATANRALAAPWTLLADHQDSVSQRDTGWIQFYCENDQEVLDTIIQAYRVAEDKQVLLPAMVNLEGFILSHTIEGVSVPDQAEVDAFLPPYAPELYLDPAEPKAMPQFASNVWFPAFKFQQEEAMQKAKGIIEKVDSEYQETFARSYDGMLEPFMCEDAEAAVVVMGTAASTARKVVMDMRHEGKAVGLIKLRVFRPFPEEEFRALAEKIRSFAVIDRDYSFGQGGAVFTELRSALYKVKGGPSVLGFVVGLGGQDVSEAYIKHICELALKGAQTGAESYQMEWLGIKRRC